MIKQGKPKVLIFASGTKDGGGSGFQEMVENSTTGILDAEIVGVVSNHPNGGVRRIANAYDVPFYFFQPPFTAQAYQGFVKETGSQWVMLSGWSKLVRGLEENRTINIHPGPLPDFGGPGMHGHRVHEKVLQAYKDGKINCSAVTMHFVDPQWDHGQIFFRYPVLIRPDDTPEILAMRVNKIEHGWQSFILNLVIHGEIALIDDKLAVPNWYQFNRAVHL